MLVIDGFLFLGNNGIKDHKNSHKWTLNKKKHEIWEKRIKNKKIIWEAEKIEWEIIRGTNYI